MSLELATVLLAGATFLLAVFAGIQAWLTRRLAEASTRQLKIAAPPSLHLARTQAEGRKGFDVDLADDGRLTVRLQNLGQAEAHVNSSFLTGAGVDHPGKPRKLAVDRVLASGGKRYELTAKLPARRAESLRRGEQHVTLWIAYTAEGSGRRYLWSARLLYWPRHRGMWTVGRIRTRLQGD